MHKTNVEQYRQSITRAAAHLNSGNTAAAEQTLLQLDWQGDVNGLHLYARVALQRNDADAAIAVLLRAIEIAPTLGQLQFSLGNAYRLKGDLTASCTAYERSLQLEPQNANAQFNLGLSLSSLARPKAAARAFFVAYQIEPTLYDAAQQCMLALATLTQLQDKQIEASEVGDVANTTEPITVCAPSDLTMPTFSVVICSINPEKYARIEKRYRELIPDAQLQLIGIHDALGLAEAYNRGIKQSFGQILIFSHDDIEILNDDFASVVTKHLACFDAVGVAGTTLLNGPSIGWSGHRHARGWVTHITKSKKYSVGVNGLSMQHAAGAQALDGVFLAVRGNVARKCQFDERAQGFHFYDVEFSYALYKQGYSVAVVSDVRLVHESSGNFDSSWQASAANFLQRHPELNAPQSPSFTFAADLESTKQVTDFYRLLELLERFWDTNQEDWDIAIEQAA